MTESSREDATEARLKRIEESLSALHARIGSVEADLARLHGPARKPEPSPEPVRPRPTPPPPREVSPPPIPTPVAEPEPEEWQASDTLPSYVVGPTDRTRTFPPRREGIKWAELLRRLNLLPPEGKGNLEMQVGTWWATRIGVLLIVIFGVFFGVYVSQNTPHWVKFVELAAISLGVTVFGLWIEKKFEEFGAVIFGGGLAMIYFTAFAAYVVPPVKVLFDPEIAVYVQFAAVAAILACSLWRDSRIIASMATLFGFIACLFSFSAGLNNYCLIASLFLGACAVCLYLSRKKWSEPLQIAVPFTYFLYALIWGIRWLGDRQPPTFDYGLGFLLAYMLMYGIADYAALLRGTLMPKSTRRLVQIFNTTGAIGLGYLFTRTLFPVHLASFYFIFGAVLMAGSLAYYAWSLRKSGIGDVLMHVYFVKGSALIALGLVTQFEGRTRWIALGVESFVLLFSARRSRLRVVEVMMMLVWFASLGYFWVWFGQSGFSIDILSRPAAFALGYVLLSALFLSLQGRWFATGGAAGFPSLASISPRVELNVLYAVVLGLTATVIAATSTYGTDGQSYEPIVAFLVAILLVCVAAVARHWIPYIAAAFPFVAAHVLAIIATDKHNSFELRLNSLVVVGLTIATVAVLAIIASRKKTADSKSASAFAVVGAVMHVLWMLTLVSLYKRGFDPRYFLFLSVCTSIVAAAVSSRAPLLALGDLSFLPMLLALIMYAAPPYPVAGWPLWIAAVGSLGYASAYVVSGRLQQALFLREQRTAYHIAHTAVATLVTFAALTCLFEHRGFLLAAAIAGIVVSLLTRWPGLKPAVFGGGFLLAAAHVDFYQIVDGRKIDDLTLLTMTVAAGALTLLYAVIVSRLRAGLSDTTHAVLQSVSGAAALLLVYDLFYSQGGSLANYVTVFWGVSAITTLLAGLLARAKPLRVIGLAGLAVCIPRVFVVDVKSTLYRIVAFGALGAVLLLVGFVYSKYRTRIEPGVIRQPDEDIR